jgi:hypothetical protein
MAEEIKTNGVEVQEAVNAALNDQKKKKKKKKLIILLVIVIVAVVAIVVASSGSSDEDTTPVMTITADEIIGDYQNNELSADSTYKDKYVTITECTITNINDGYFYVDAKDEDLWLDQMVVYYNDDQSDTVAKLSEDDIITVTGKVSGTDTLDDVKVVNATVQVDE